ncbi:cation transporter [Kordiimonas sp. SCSIO 12610]|uniref:cation transporter n=1 Tax=Kordiimonas sp. SCSIO 12610 TaxID=2829597 RepID=UPI00210E1F23|nr:cation transporter [Kordiimonas sp. SCSIO 12610]UTW55172.1 cation transporter [Kordiimonas sp. SCSIO 12610]
MSAGCGCHEVNFEGLDPAYKRALILVIIINALMFLVEMPMGFVGNSQALKADALDFLADTLTYGISLYVIGKANHLRAKVALMKGFSLFAMGLWVLGSTIYSVFYLQQPTVLIMGSVGFAALSANLISVLLLVKYKDGDANVRSVWLCSRNDAINNVMVLIAASGVWATNTGWPDIIVAGIMASIFISGAFSIITQARHELEHIKSHSAAE